MKPNFDQVIEILKKMGLSDSEIGKMVESLSNALSQNLYLAIVENLSEEDMARLNLITDDTERQRQMRQIFEQKSGQNLQDLSDSFIKSYVEEFTQGYQSIQ